MDVSSKLQAEGRKRTGKQQNRITCMKQRQAFCEMLVPFSSKFKVKTLVFQANASLRQRLHERGFKSSRFHTLETASKTIQFQSVYTVPISPFSSAYVMPISFRGTHY